MHVLHRKIKSFSLFSIIYEIINFEILELLKYSFKQEMNVIFVNYIKNSTISHSLVTNK